MDQLLPIIRRKRRPLIEADVPSDAAGPIQPVAANPLVESVPAVPPPAKPTLSDGENIPQPESE
jgi:hypothetical protein